MTFGIELTPVPSNTTTGVYLSDILLKTAECLKGLRYGNSTDTGTSSTLVDSAMDEPMDQFNGGTIFFLSGALQGLTAVITDWDVDSHTFTFPTQFSAPGTGISYAVFDANYKRDALIAAVNAALVELGPFQKILDDALTTVADQESYDLPSGVYNIKKVFIASSLTAPYQYQENTGWFEEEGKLWFDMEVPATAGYSVRLYYEAPHDVVWNDTDIITNAVHPELLAWTAANHAIITRMGVAENSEPNTKELLQIAAQKAALAKKHAIKHWQKASRPSGW